MIRISDITVLFLVWLRIRQGESKLCYDKVCFSENCLQLDISGNTVSTCQMNETYGCWYEIVRSTIYSTSLTIRADCATRECSPHHQLPEHERLCCKDNLCNDGTHILDNSSTTHCHSFHCTSSWDCLKEGIKKGYSRTCPRDPQYGCYVDRTQSGSVTEVTAGCSSNPCSERYIAGDVVRRENKCCKGDMCNDGTEVQDPSQTYCYTFACTSDLDCLREGIKRKMTVECPMDMQYGCFIHKAQASGLVAVSAGCSYSTSSCRPGKLESPGNKVEIICCTGNLCNDDNGGAFVNSSFVVTAFFILLARSSILNE